MVLPALIYLAVSAGALEALGGWAIPIATDVALVLGLLAFFGAAVSPGLLAFVSAVAIFDDLGAVIVVAFFNSGVALGGGGNWLTDPVAQGIMAAVYVGKPLGVLLGMLCALRSGIGVLPAKITLRDVASAALFSGIGFTVSLFIATEAFEDHARTGAAKIAILIGSGLSALLASIALAAVARTSSR